METTDQHLTIDLADPQDIRSKLPAARELYLAKRGQLEELTKEVEHWGALVDLLAQSVGEKGIEPTRHLAGGSAQRHARVTTPDGRKRAPAQELALRALEQAKRPMGPAELFRFMEAEGMKTPSNANALGATLWTAAKAQRIKKTPEGLYAPPGWEPDQDELYASRNGVNTDADPGPENEAGEPLSTATQPQEGT